MTVTVTDAQKLEGKEVTLFMNNRFRYEGTILWVGTKLLEIQEINKQGQQKVKFLAINNISEIEPK